MYFGASNKREKANSYFGRMLMGVDPDLKFILMPKKDYLLSSSMHTVAKNIEKKSTDECHGQPRWPAESQEVENPLQRQFFLMLVVVNINNEE